MNTVTIAQVEGIGARQILDEFAALKTQIQTLAERMAANAPAPVGYLTRQAVAELLGVSLVTVTDWTNKGFLKSYRLGNRVYFKAAEIDAAMLEIPAGKRRAAA